MTTTTATTGRRLAEQAIAARGGADLFRFALGDRIPDSAFKADDAGAVTVTGIDLLKEGTFNGLTINANDLESMVTSFHSLLDAGIFAPPLRLDHSWSVLSVIGYFTNLETYRRTDSTDNLEKAFLRGDVALTGSLDYPPAVLVEAIKRGALSNRSSEIGFYMTNSGVEIPWCFYGNAFVDIPAVEGLAPVSLSRRPEPHQITNLTVATGGAPNMLTAEQIARLAELRRIPEQELSAEDRTELDGLLALEATAEGGEGDESSSEEGDGEGDGSEGDGDEGSSSAEGDGSSSEEGTPAGTTEDAPGGAPAEQVDELAQARAEIARLRQAETTRQIAQFTTSGAITDVNREDATALLSHNDENVRRAAGTILGGLSSRVSLGKRGGQTALSNDGNGSGQGGDLIRLGMTKAEVGALWQSLSTEQRKAHQGEYDSWRKDRDENGIRD